MSKAKPKISLTEVSLAGNKPSLREWDLSALEGLPKLEDIVIEAASEAIGYALQEPALCYIPFEYSCWDEPGDGMFGPPVKDPLLMRIRLPLAAEDEEPYWEVDLRDVFMAPVETHEYGEGGELSPEAIPMVTAIRDELQKIVVFLTEAINRKGEGQ